MITNQILLLSWVTQHNHISIHQDKKKLCHRDRTSFTDCYMIYTLKPNGYPEPGGFTAVPGRLGHVCITGPIRHELGKNHWDAL